jgi:hypothetical protein
MGCSCRTWMWFDPARRASRERLSNKCKFLPGITLSSGDILFPFSQLRSLTEEDWVDGHYRRPSCGRGALYGILAIGILLDALKIQSNRLIAYSLVGAGLALAVAAFQVTRIFVSARPRLSRSLAKILLFVAAATALVGGPKLYSAWQLHEMLLAAQSEIQKQLPKKVDVYTTLIDVQVGFTAWTYLYEVTIPKSKFDLAALERIVRRDVCASDMNKRMSDGVSYNHEYRDKAGSILGQFEIARCP